MCAFVCVCVCVRERERERERESVVVFLPRQVYFTMTVMYCSPLSKISVGFFISSW